MHRWQNLTDGLVFTIFPAVRGPVSAKTEPRNFCWRLALIAARTDAALAVPVPTSIETESRK
ncbi:MAG: hypothetical protein C0511_13850 [Hyphomicrobium sp.]|nr:hypothetical protein [Hyphomicrobium sp.]PPC80512.1 MAG: hypothetical protein CTY40_09130 [Hyphomicrobium sp.]